MSEGATAIRFDSVSRRFGDEFALRELSLALAENRVTAIVGESGSGKSTLLQHVNGLLRPDSGGVTVLGDAIDYAALPRLRRRIGYAVQGIGLFPHLRIDENIVLLARIERWSEERIVRRRDHLLAMMGLEQNLLHRYPHELSGGQQQRVGLCRAMLLEPPLLLLDEPFSGVDPMTRLRIHEEFLRLQRTEPRTVVLVTHDLREAQRLSDDIAILRAGRLLQHGATSEVIAAPADDYVDKLFREHLT